MAIEVPAKPSRAVSGNSFFFLRTIYLSIIIKVEEKTNVR